MLRQPFNNNWTCVKDDSALMVALSSAPSAVTLPHDAMIWEKRDPKAAAGSSGAFFPNNNYLYQKTFRAPKEYEGKRVQLEFEGVYHKSRVYINGALAATCNNGYRRFLVDLTPYLNCGEDNSITVKVMNKDATNSRWYTGSGIYRPVNLLVGGPFCIAANGLRITTPEVAEDVSEVRTEIRFENRLTGTSKVYFVTTISDAEGRVVSTECTPLTVYPGKAPTVYQHLYVKNARLWSLEDPNLYTMRVAVMDAKGCSNARQCLEKNILLDEAVSTFGIRHIQVDPVHGLRLNGKRVLLRGECIHHDNGLLGAATYADAEARRVRLSKEAGFNSIRVSHNPASVALLDACDRLGVLVMEESFDMWTNAKSQFDDAQGFFDEWEKDITSIVEKDFNHPCVFMYCIGNEIQEIGSPFGASVNRDIANKVRALDPGRLVTNAMNGLMTVMGSPKMDDIIRDAGFEGGDPSQNGGDINDLMTIIMGATNQLAAHYHVSENLEESVSGLDLVGYNYMSGRYATDPVDYPNRICYGSETYPPEIDLNWKHTKKTPAVLGDYCWTGWDYLGEAGVGVTDYNETSGFSKPYPCYLAYCGDIDLTGYRRPLSYFREIVWGLRSAPYIAVEPPMHHGDTPLFTPWAVADSVSSWSWSGCEGKPAKVIVYSDAEEVELLINGKSVGRAAAGEENRFQAAFEVIYEPGTIEAVGYTAGRETGRYALRTTGEAARLSVSSDRSEVRANGQDLVYVDIELTDAEGILKTDQELKVQVQVEGAGSLQGFGSADPRSEENFFDTVRTTFNGRLQAVVRAGQEPGEIKVLVTAPGLGAREVLIVSKSCQ